MEDPTVPRGFKALTFLAPGAPDKARRMALEVIGKLPEGAKATLEVPHGLFELLHQADQLGHAAIDRKRGSERLQTASPFNIKTRSLTMGNFSAEDVRALPFGGATGSRCSAPRPTTRSPPTWC